MIATERLTVDTSVVAKLYLDDEEFTQNALELFQRYAEGRANLVAPFLIYYELPNTILQAVYRRRLDLRRAREAIEAFFDLNLPVIGGGEATGKALLRAAVEVALQYRCSVYDAVFLMVAEALNAPLITADAKFFNSAKGRTSNIIWIGDYVPTN